MHDSESSDLQGMQGIVYGMVITIPCSGPWAWAFRPILISAPKVSTSQSKTLFASVHIPDVRLLLQEELITLITLNHRRNKPKIGEEYGVFISQKRLRCQKLRIAKDSHSWKDYLPDAPFLSKGKQDQASSFDRFFSSINTYSRALSACNTWSTSLVHKMHVSRSAGSLSRWLTAW